MQPGPFAQADATYRHQPVTAPSVRKGARARRGRGLPSARAPAMAAARSGAGGVRPDLPARTERRGAPALVASLAEATTLDAVQEVPRQMLPVGILARIQREVRSRLNRIARQAETTSLEALRADAAVRLRELALR